MDVAFSSQREALREEGLRAPRPVAAEDHLQQQLRDGGRDERLDQRAGLEHQRIPEPKPARLLLALPAEIDLGPFWPRRRW